MTEVTTLEVNKADWANTRLVEESLGTMGENEVLLRVDRQALTANNISYAGAGDTIGYWGFFPAEEGWGRIPAMGWADVVASGHPDIAVGERVWGFYPLSTHLRILAGHVTEAHFDDVSPHRAEYAPVYARFDRASANPLYETAREDQDSLLRGLFLTSWLVEDFLTYNDSFGAKACLITSASSKTSIALGFCVKKRGSLESIGLTSQRNRAFCESLGCYDRVVTYDNLSTLDGSQLAVSVDMAGNMGLLSDLHHRYADNLKHSCRVGATHHAEFGAADDMPGPPPEFFFAPGHIQSRSKDIGAAKLMMAMGADYVTFRVDADRWLQTNRSYGPEAVEQVYQSVLSGGAAPDTGQIISMWPDAS